jgi:RNA polymerase sigma-70 factor (ECF subfamily)
VKSKVPATALDDPAPASAAKSAESAKSEKKGAGVPDREGVALLPSEMATAASTATDPFGADLQVQAAPRRLFTPKLAEAVAPAPAADLPSDEVLVAAIRRGDRALGRLIYKRLIRVIESTLCRVLGRGERDHGDLVQAVFEEVVRTIHSGQFQMRCSLTSWAATIACHVGLNAIRSRRMERTVFDLDQPIDAFGEQVETADPERALDARAELRRLRIALAAMPEGRAEAVLMHDVLGYDLAEVAALSDSTVAAVQSRLVRGRKELLERMERVREEVEANQ